MRYYRAFRGPSLLLLTGLFSSALPAQDNSLGGGGTVRPASTSLTVDDFEGGVGSWTRNDKSKAAGGAAVLADILATPAGDGAPESHQAALVTFKAGRASWASLSLPVDGPAWSNLGSTRLTFWLNAGGETNGVFLQLRGHYGPGKTTEMLFSLPRPVRLDIQHWRKVVIPLTDFKGPHGEALAPRLNGIDQLSLSQNGDWDSRFFKLDDIRVEGTGTPIALATPGPAPVATPKSTPIPVATAVAGDIKVSADFLKTSGAVRAAGNVTLGNSYGGSSVSPLDNSVAFRQALALLRPKFVKINAAELCDLTDSSLPGFDFSRLLAATVKARSWGAEPLISLANPTEWGLDSRGFAAFAAGAARALNRKSGPGARYFELATADESSDNLTTLNSYNTAYIAIKGLSKNFRVGGFGADANNSQLVSSLLSNAPGLDFLSVSYYGATTGQPGDSVVLAAARDVTGVKSAAGLLDKSKFALAPLYVTSANLSTAHNEGENVPSDIRLVQGVSAAWWAQFLASGSKVSDQIFHNDAVNSEWGLLDPNAHAYPAYYTMWLWNTYFAGSTRVAASSDNAAVFVAACNTATAHNLLLVNTTRTDQSVQIGIRGFPVLREARLRLFDDPQKTVAFTPLPKSPFQSVHLAPYAVAIVQFIEPPKKKP